MAAGDSEVVVVAVLAGAPAKPRYSHHQTARNFPQLEHPPNFFVQAKFNGEDLATDPVLQLPTFEIQNELVLTWACMQLTWYRRGKSTRKCCTSIACSARRSNFKYCAPMCYSLQCFAVDGDSKPTLCGYVLLDLRAAKQAAVRVLACYPNTSRVPCGKRFY